MAYVLLSDCLLVSPVYFPQLPWWKNGRTSYSTSLCDFLCWENLNDLVWTSSFLVFFSGIPRPQPLCEPHHPPVSLFPIYHQQQICYGKISPSLVLPPCCSLLFILPSRCVNLAFLCLLQALQDLLCWLSHLEHLIKILYWPFVSVTIILNCFSPFSCFSSIYCENSMMGWLLFYFLKPEMVGNEKNTCQGD